MELDEVMDKTCVIGLSYFDKDGSLMKQSQLAGTVCKIDAELGISVRLQALAPAAPAAGAGAGADNAPPLFILPPNLAAWFKAPPGHYRHAESGVDMKNPDFLVTWNIWRTQGETAEGQHEWWEWLPNTEAPQVGQRH